MTAKTDEGRRGRGAGGWTVEDALEMTTEEILALPAEAFGAVGEEDGAGVSLATIYAALGRPTGTEALSSPVATTAALETPFIQPGDYVIENCVTGRGLKRLKVQRLGRAPWRGVYIEQAQAAGAQLIEAWEWADAERRLFTLTVLWK